MTDKEQNHERAWKERIQNQLENLEDRIEQVAQEIIPPDDDTVDDGCRTELNHQIDRIGSLEETATSKEEFEWLRDKVSALTDELRSVERELDRQINDERSDRERADNDIKSDLESLRHDVQYGR